MAEPVELDARLDELFAAAPEEFVTAREALVRDLKRRAARRRGRRGERAAHAHGRGLGRQPDGRTRSPIGSPRWSRPATSSTHCNRSDAGARDELRAATRPRRTLLDQLTDVAAALHRAARRDPCAIAATLDAASLDHELRDDLARGRLTTELVSRGALPRRRSATSAMATTTAHQPRADVPRPVRRGSRRRLRRVTTSRFGGPRPR